MKKNKYSIWLLVWGIILVFSIGLYLHLPATFSLEKVAVAIVVAVSFFGALGMFLLLNQSE